MRFDQKPADQREGEIRLVARFTAGTGLEVRVWSSPPTITKGAAAQLFSAGLLALSTKLVETMNLGPATDLTALGIDVSGDE